MSIWSKRKGSFIDSDIEPHFSDKRYRPHHGKIQKKINRFNQDYYFVISGDSHFETGTNQKKINIDCYNNFDMYKDGNI